MTDASSSSPTSLPLWLRFTPIALMALALGLALTFRVHDLISLETLRTRREELDAFVAAYFLQALVLYFLIYTLAVAICLPGAIALSVVGGFLFGLYFGAAATWAGATIGAVLVFLAAKTALGDALRTRAGGWLSKLEAGFRNNAFNYLLALRLFPGTPYFAVNLAAGFFGVRLRTFFLATLIGIFPATIIYAAIGAGVHTAFEIGTELATADTMRALVFSPAIMLPLLGLVALSLLPLVAHALRKKAPARL